MLLKRDIWVIIIPMFERSLFHSFITLFKKIFLLSINLLTVFIRLVLIIKNAILKISQLCFIAFYYEVLRLYVIMSYAHLFQIYHRPNNFFNKIMQLFLAITFQLRYIQTRSTSFSLFKQDYLVSSLSLLNACLQYPTLAFKWVSF